MRRALVAVLALGGCTVAGPRPGVGAAPTASLSTEPAVRVGLVVDAPSVEVDTDGRLELVEESGRVRARSGRGWIVTPSSGGVTALNDDATIRVSGSLLARPVQGRIRVDGVAYRGAVLLRAAGGGVTAVNLLDLETYLLGVVPLEIGAGRPQEEVEAVKAQAIAARTYAVRHLGRRDGEGFDYYGNVRDQAYGGADGEDPVATRAVEETRGRILTYRGEPIEAYYHSTCGGRTAALEEVWNGEPRPYLRSVSDAMPGGGSYCQASSRFTWTETWTGPALTNALAAGLRSQAAGTITEVRSVSVDGRTPSGRARALEVETNLGVIRVRGDSIRWVLRPEPDRSLFSTLIEIHGDPASGLTVEGRGWGHGIGMCQNGALGRARAGQSYRDILSTYYPGTRLVQLY